MSRNLQRGDWILTHNHSSFSRLDGLTQLEDLVKKVKNDGANACCITDHGTMGSHAEFLHLCEQNQIKPLFGVEVYIVDDYERVVKEQDRNRFHLTLIAKTRKGYTNLCKMMYIANKDQFYYKPLIDLKTLEENKDDVILLDGCASSMVSEHLKVDEVEEAKKLMLWYKNLFGDDYYTELQLHGCPNAPKKWDLQEKINKHKLKLAKELGVKPILSADSHYLEEGDEDTHEILLCIGTGKYLSDTDRMSLKDFDLHVPTFDEVIKYTTEEYDESIKNTKVLADSCEFFSIGDGRTYLPNYIVESGRTQEEEIKFLTFKGACRRYLNKDVDTIEQARNELDEKLVSRLDYELSVIHKLGFDGYLLIVQEFINWGKERGILYGYGRGSSSSAVTCYCLGITECDTMKHKEFLFERFMNPERLSLADIDTDIEDTRRDEVIQHMIDRYGEDNVCGILTLGTMRPKNAFRDVARVMEFPYDESLRITKTIPDAVYGGGKEFPELLNPENKETEDFREYLKNPDVKKIVDEAAKLEGNVRNIGQHACGLLVTPKPIYEFCPVEKAGDGLVSGFTMHYTEGDLGIFKFDFLGLGNLGIAADCIEQIKRTKNINVDFYNTPEDDEETFDMFCSGESKFTFTFPSDFIRNFCKEFRPRTIYDLAIVTAIGRPGPMQWMPHFIKRKNGEEPIKCIECMRPFLENTYGFLTFQEQFMLMATELCGFSGGDADNARKALAKKNLLIMAEIKPKFWEGIKKHGADEKEFNHWWNELQAFASYSFNFSHAYAYAKLGYVTGYLLTHYPAEYLAAVMNKTKGDKDKIREAIAFAKTRGVNVKSPSALESGMDFTATKDGNIVYGLSGIKGLGKTSEQIINAVKEYQPKTLQEFLLLDDVPSGKIEALAKAGALDCFGNARREIVYNIDEIKKYKDDNKKKKSKAQKVAAKQTSMFDSFGELFSPDKLELALPPNCVNETTRLDTIIQALVWEKDYVGTFITMSPSNFVETDNKNWEKQIDGKIEITPNEREKYIIEDIPGIITKVEQKWTRKQTRMGFITIDAKGRSIKLICFSKQWENIKDNIKENNLGRFTIQFGDDKMNKSKVSQSDEAVLVSSNITYHFGGKK